MLIGYCITGSFCTIAKSIEVLRKLRKRGDSVIPILSECAGNLDTRFGKAKDLVKLLEEITENSPITDIAAAETLGPKIKCDIMAVAPATSNTIAKIAHGVTDNTVTLAVKAHLRNARPVVIAPCTNDGLGASAKNIGLLLERKHFYFAPMYQDDYINKPRSLLSDFDRLAEAIDLAQKGIQIQPILKV